MGGLFGVWEAEAMRMEKQRARMPTRSAWGVVIFLLLYFSPGLLRVLLAVTRASMWRLAWVVLFCLFVVFWVCVMPPLCFSLAALSPLPHRF